ncbi:hypothetical protein HK103_000850 [Boothiomyces macroporosus]|uniref:C3H1-type domain-containing protein n=1 Tax=Boothiomyces macroporosus TaxID=261099 RepID=A0AAD5UBI9_9FUNG|nr:hypothetical protein HK103_000850 [Boothiomyces macroporosus]
MVKGNGDRRRQLAQQRKQDQRNEIQRKLGGSELATPDEVRARLLDDCRKKNIPEDLLIAYVKHPTDDTLQCPSFISTGYCETKRCRYRHVDNLNKLGVQVDQPVPILERKPLRQVPASCKLVYNRTIRTKVRQDSPLIFIELEGQLVFNVYDPKVFAKYAQKNPKEIPEKIGIVDKAALNDADTASVAEFEYLEMAESECNDMDLDYSLVADPIKLGDL